MKKYEMVVDQTLSNGGKPLYRIRATRSFGCVLKGEIGGYIEYEGNLSHVGDAWVSDNAQISLDADVVCMTGVGSEYGVLTAYRTSNGVEVNRGCFCGSLQEFADAVDRTHGDSKFGAEYRLLIQYLKLKFQEKYHV